MENITKEKLTINLIHRKFETDAVGGMATKDDDNKYTVFINNSSERTHIKQLASFLHEMTHIYNKDFDKLGMRVSEIERNTHRQLREALEYLVNEGSELEQW